MGERRDGHAQRYDRAPPPPPGYLDLARDPAWRAWNGRLDASLARVVRWEDRNRPEAHKKRLELTELFVPIYADRQLQTDARMLIEQLTFDKIDNPNREAIIDAWTDLRSGRDPSRLPFGSTVLELARTRPERWERLAATLDRPRPLGFRAYRGARNNPYHDFVRDVATAWKRGATAIEVVQDPLAAWALTRLIAEDFSLQQGRPHAAVVFGADLPFAQTFADKLVDDSSFVVPWWTQSEITAGDYGAPVLADPRITTVRFGGRDYLHSQAATLVTAYEAAHGRL